ncbi:MAG: hypothetical protein MUC83_19725 [Pirellula sp.]|jgi:hypothetical protein|nr:hypothetical protein [Pirellula sp.]
MKKDPNSIMAAIVCTAVFSVAVGYGITFWEHWQASQHALSSFSSSPTALKPRSEEQRGAEPAILDAPRKPFFIEETAM